MSTPETGGRRNFLKTLLAGAATVIVYKQSALAETATTEGKKQYAFVVDTSKCIGCGKCVEACSMENQVPEGSYRTWVERYVVTAEGIYIDSPEGAINSFPQLAPEIHDAAKWAAFIPKLCNHCENAPCVQVCPVGATFRTNDGFVLIDPEHCIGCGYCIQACPYGARFFNQETKMADKCTWCYHRVTKGLLPACVTVCPTNTRSFGEITDPDGYVAKVFAENKWQVLKPYMHTDSWCLYLELPRKVI
jgi:Fe-S-cluster-containing dehydrogenase component